jgi:hypothetical protein
VDDPKAAGPKVEDRKAGKEDRRSGRSVRKTKNKSIEEAIASFFISILLWLTDDS